MGSLGLLAEVSAFFDKFRFIISSLVFYFLNSLFLAITCAIYAKTRRKVQER